jgi:hypothetical protein
LCDVLAAKIAHRFGCLNGTLCRLLWDTGCSHELIAPLFARSLISSGAKWEFLEHPTTIEHGNADCVGSGTPATIRVCLDVLLVHKTHIFQQKDVWFLVYDDSLPDAMLSGSASAPLPLARSTATSMAAERSICGQKR